MKTISQPIFLLIILSTICTTKIYSDDKIPCNFSQNENSWKLKWQKMIFTNSLSAYSHPLTIEQNSIIYATRFYGGPDNPPDGVLLFNKYSGEKNFTWGDIPSGFQNEEILITNYTITTDDTTLILVSTDKGIYAFDLKTAQQKWEKSFFNYSTDSWVCSLNGDALISYYKSEGPGTHWARLAILSKEEGSDRTILTLTADSVDDEVVYLMPAKEHISENNDTLLYFSASYWNFTDAIGRIELYCYNLTLKKFVWTKKDFTADTDAGKFPPIITDAGNVIFHCQKSIHCVNRKNGAIVWQTDIQGDAFQYTSFLHLNRRLYCQTNLGKIICVDDLSGETLWTAEGNYPPNRHGHLDYYKDRLYCIGNPEFSGELFVFSLKTGNLLERGQISKENLKGGITIDQTTGLAYLTGNYSVLCIDLEPKNKEF